MTKDGIQFECEGCGVLVFGFGIDRVPLHGFCAQCAWLCEFVTDPETFDVLFKQFCEHAWGDRKQRRRPNVASE